MLNSIKILLLGTLLYSTPLAAQVILVDLGLDSTYLNKYDTIKTNSILTAIELSYGITDDSIQILLSPGIYILKDIVPIKKSSKNKINSTLIIRSLTNPDQEFWENKHMPIIMSISDNNDSTGFPHSVGFLVQRNNVYFSGIKFLGNANPEVLWYYPISRKDTLLRTLHVNQCVFIGEENSLPLQAGIYGFGPNIEIGNNVFKGCRNASLFFDKAEYSSFSSNIVLNADESIVWISDLKGNFKLTNNLVKDSNFGIVKSAVDSNIYSIKGNIFNQVDTLVITYDYQIDSLHNAEYYKVNLYNVELTSNGKGHPYWHRRNLHFNEPKKTIGIFTK